MTKALPAGFVAQMEQLLGANEAHQLCQSLELVPPTSIRFNQRKKLPEAYMPQGAGIVPWCPWGIYLEYRPVFTGDPRLHSGYYYVQEASSMLLALVAPLLGNEPLIALDLSAAPGGKSTLISDLLPYRSVLVSNEIVGHRANILVENMQKWGNPYSVVCSTSPKHLGQLANSFDFVLVDAPCSGEGMFRKDVKAREEWRVDAPVLCAERQRTILSDIWTSLKPGGLMVYSTCTFNRQENEDIVDYIITELGAEAIALPNTPQGILRSPYSPHPCYRMMPHLVQGEGLFMAVLRKENAEVIAQKKRKSRPRSQPSVAIPQEMKGWIETAEPYLWEMDAEHNVIAYPKELAPVLEILREHRIPILMAGVMVGQQKGKSLLPAPALCLSQVARLEAWEAVELSPEEVIPYLSREAVSLSPEYTQGLKLITAQGLPLGFAKHLGNRTNNLYPPEWRIRHAEKLQQYWADGEWL